MTDLPQVGQKYQHKKLGDVEVNYVAKRGGGYRVGVWVKDRVGGRFGWSQTLNAFRKETN